MRLLSLAAFALLGLSAAPQADEARKILEGAGVKGGFFVHLGCGDGELTAAFRTGDGVQVQGLERDASKVEKARAHVRSKGFYGPVSVDRLTGDRLPYIDRLVNLLVAEDLQGIPMEEILRVLVPRGVAYLKRDGAWTKTVKPVPAEVDDWTHYLHGPDGNPAGRDTEIGPPRQLQWLGSPRWSRHHDRMASMSALVSNQGRLFYVMDEGSRISILLPPKWMLIARDGYNGVVLWKRPLEDWQNHLWPLKSGPTQLARRLVAEGDRVYVTLGYSSPITALDAATGEVVRTYDKTRATEELLVSGETIFALVNEGEMELASYAPQQSVGDQKRVATEFVWNRKPRRIAALEAGSGRTAWSHEAIVAPLSLAADAKRVYFHDGDRVVSLDRTTGKQAWAQAAGKRPETPFHQGVRLIVLEGAVLCKGTDRILRAFAPETGKELWSAPAPPGGYQSPEDLLVVGGLVWTAPTTSTKDSGIFTGRDPRTGEVKVEFPPDASTYWFHHRCYIAKGSGKYLLTARTGLEFVDPTAKHWTIHHWVRGGCLYGVLPANGLVYTPPHDCACYPEAKLFGFNALAPASPSRAALGEVPEEGRLEKGPAYETALEEDGIAAWPTYRGDSARSGFTKDPVGAGLAKAWDVTLGGRLSAITVAGGRLHVAKVDEHQVIALDAATGKSLWTFTAGGRVDSPPTLWKGRALFGSADGWVYCLRASDGALAWRFRGAPRDLRHMALEQLESVWPVNGSVLVQEGTVHAVAGRSAFLDGGLRYLRIDARTGRRLTETVLNDKDPETGGDLQERIKVLQMPVGLNDILSSDGKQVFLRSQKFSLEGERLGLGPNSGDAPEQASVQKGTDAHVFAPYGYLDDTGYHRGYWVFGRSFAGGHNGYFQAAKYTPAGQILVHNEETVYGYGRKPEYLKWTTPMEFQLFAAQKEAEVVKKPGPQGKPAPSHPEFLWTQDVPILARAMVLAGRTLLVAGPPDLIDEEAAFKALAKRDEDTKKRLVEQDAAFAGNRGAVLRAVSAADGKTLSELKLDVPPLWDGMSVAGGRVFIATLDGRIFCFGSR
jgi:outer membrane protein assembly factor BamB